MIAAPVVPIAGALCPVPLDHVRITGGFWADRQRVNSSATLEHCVAWMDRLGWTANFAGVASGREFTRSGREFSDSEVYKIIEALVWERARGASAWLDDTYQRLTDVVISAQQADGYLNTNFGSPGQQARYSDLEWGHELYCAGHLIQAAVASIRTRGRDEFVEAAVRLADHVCREFGPGGRDGFCGHPEIEVALAELGRATGDRRYLDQARLFIERRGHGLLDGSLFGSAYFQDDTPVRDASVLRGHAVRALYLSAGAADVAVEFGDGELLERLGQQWATTVARRTYLTGGMGSRHEGESFGNDFELPSDRAYCETCAGVGSVMFSWRLLLANGAEEYADLIERTLYNVIASSPSEDGTHFFYVNPLESTVVGGPPSETEPSTRAESSRRAPWFTVSCCPPNIARTLASLSAYVATVDDHGLQLHQFVDGDIDTQLPDGAPVAMTIQTGYPYDGRVVVTIREAPTRPWTLSFRIPSWVGGDAMVTIDGLERRAPAGRADVTREFVRGDTIELTLPMEPRFTVADPRIDALRSQAALERGPLVYCLESIDLPADFTLDRVDLQTSQTPVVEPGGDVAVSVTCRTATDDPWPYSVDRTPAPTHSASIRDSAPSARVRMIPYHRWAQREPAAMRVWLPRSTR